MLPDAGCNLKMFAWCDARTVCPAFQLQSQTLRGDLLKILYLAFQVRAETFSAFFIDDELICKVGVDVTQLFEPFQDQICSFDAILEAELNISGFDLISDFFQARSQEFDLPPG